MSNIDILEKAIEIDIMEFNKNMALMEDADYIAFVEGDYYEESGNNKENFFEKAIRYVRDLIKKVKDKIAEKFSDANVKRQQEKLKMEILSDPNKKNKKVKVRVNDKVYDLDKKALGDLTKCKTKEEVEKYMSDYKKKREKLVAGSIVAVSAATAIGILGSKLHKTHKQLDELQGEYEKSIKTISNLNGKISDMKKLDRLQTAITKKQGDRINDLENRNKKILKAARDNRNNSKEYLNKIVKDASYVKKTAIRGKNYYYNDFCTLFDGDMDATNEYIENDFKSGIISEMNSIIRDAISLGADIKPAIG